MAEKSQKNRVHIRQISKIFIVWSILFIYVLTPIFVNAGVLSNIVGWLGISADASSTEIEGSIAEPAILLEAANNINPTSSKNGETVVAVGNQALLSESGISGTGADVVDAHTSDAISVYVVRKGDTIASIATMYGVSVNTIRWANDLKSGIKEGDVLTILPVSGIKYVVKKGDTLSSIAKKYTADAQEIAQFNDLDPTAGLIAGVEIIIPDAEPNVATPGVSTSKTSISTPTNYSGFLIRPVSGGRKTQNIHGHNGVDIGIPIGSRLIAAASGKVIIAKSGGWNGAYGSYIVISHPNGTQTLYAHLSRVDVVAGQVVKQGQTIGATGNSGRSTGPHLHFEVRGAKNPF